MSNFNIAGSWICASAEGGEGEPEQNGKFLEIFLFPHSLVIDQVQALRSEAEQLSQEIAEFQAQLPTAGKL